MSLARRVLVPERLDHLPPDCPSAIASRRDLRRINRLSAQSAIAARALRRHLSRPPRRLLELGAGDGSGALQLARRLAGVWPGVTMVLLDRQDVVTPAIRRGFAAVGWRAEPVVTDVFAWLGRDHLRRLCLKSAAGIPDCEGKEAGVPSACKGQGHAASLPSPWKGEGQGGGLRCRHSVRHHPAPKASPDAPFDAVLANLFLHHFDARLPELLAGIARLAPLFIATEPRRDAFTLAGSRLVGLIGANAVTRHDAPVSVRAGFAGQELTALWPEHGWQTEERRAGLFTHLFVARRDA
jgi:hypothetical protein